MTDIISSSTPIQQESVQTDQPVSEAAASAIGGLANFLLSVAFPVGAIVDSMLTESQFQAQLPISSATNWILADGRDISGSALATLISSDTCPDMRGIFRRGKNNGRSDGNQNPDGDLPLGTYTADKFSLHTHTYGGVETFLSVGSGTGQTPLFPAAPTQTEATGGNETAPKNLTVNTFIRIN